MFFVPYSPVSVAEGGSAVLHTVIEGLRLRDALPPSNMMPRGSWSSISSLEMESKAEYGGLLKIFKASDLRRVYITSPAPYSIIELWGRVVNGV